MGEPAWARDITNREISTRQVGVSTDVGGIVGVFSRMQSYKKSETPPPPYEPPPPYHIALVMEQYRYQWFSSHRLQHFHSLQAQ